VPRPYVLVNMAMTADGKIDSVARRGARISSSADRVRVDGLRAAADAILVGGHTLLGEDPRLTVGAASLREERMRAGRPEQPAKIGVVSRLDLPGGDKALPSASRFLSDGGGRVIVCTTRHTAPPAVAWLEAQGVEVIIHQGDRADLGHALASLAEMGIETLMVEGGGTIVAALLEGGLVDEFQLAVAPLLFGGESAPTPVAGAGWAADDAVRLELLDTSSGDDGEIVLRYRVPGRPPA
jgi:2,5-diamino-6-(ribosylamino)-4(3H)-pyrimidinone 5'-phosphate reductase